MKDAVGSSVLFMIILGFIALYIVFIGVIMNYAATYRASNYVITSLEETEGNVSKSELVSMLRARKYYNDLEISCSTNTNGAVYQVTTFVSFDVPLLGVDLELEVRNETKTIYGVDCNANHM